MLAVDSIPVLRDGAAAPYGSDAIAGVIATAAGLPKLKEEKSKSFTLGMAWTSSKSFSMLADIYCIDINAFPIRDRYADPMPLVNIKNASVLVK